MSDIILHHFESSPFAEKIRLALGMKGITWSSVQIPMVMPKPDLTALTGGYRKTPVMQIGADIYCDTQCIARELERRHPEPSLFPAGNEGLALALSAWSDKVFFAPGAALSMGTNPDIPESVLADRKAFFNFLDFTTLTDDLPHLYGQLRSQVALIERQLRDGRNYLLGEDPAWADILAYFPVWMVRANVAGIDELLSGFKALVDWEARIAAIGHGERTDMTAGEAIAIARDCVAASEVRIDAGDPLRLEAGCRVEVLPDDYGIVPVRGELIQLTVDEIAVRREDERVGEVVVHFPRIGYRVESG